MGMSSGQRADANHDDIEVALEVEEPPGSTE
jgi:hypothetical protein